MRRISSASFCLISVLLNACIPSQQDSLGGWMQDQRNGIRPMAETVPSSHVLEHLPYTQGHLKDPFARQYWMEPVTVQATWAIPGWRLAPKSEASAPLENIAIEAMHFVGSLEQQGHWTGLVLANGIVHPVSVGQFLGNRFAKVVRVDESGIALREPVLEAGGKWYVRDLYLQTQGRGK